MRLLCGLPFTAHVYDLPKEASLGSRKAPLRLIDQLNLVWWYRHVGGDPDNWDTVSAYTHVEVVKHKTLRSLRELSCEDISSAVGYGSPLTAAAAQVVLACETTRSSNSVCFRSHAAASWRANTP